MGDLEEAFFQRNIPGKYSRWDEESDDRYHGREEDRDEGDDDHQNESNPNETAGGSLGKLGEASEDVIEKVLNADIPDSIRDGILNERSGKHNTGVKGVLADYKANKALKEAERQAKLRERNEILTRIAVGAKVPFIQEQPTSAFVQTNHHRDDNDEEEESDEDDEFLQEYRKKRLQDLKSQSNLPRFGSVKEITDSDFIDEVENVDPRVFVIVHLYETSISSSVRMNRFLEELAKAKPSYKFLRMNASSSGIEVDRVALPILNIYRGGESVDVIAGIAIEYGEFFTKEEVEWLLENSVSRFT